MRPSNRFERLLSASATDASSVWQLLKRTGPSAFAKCSMQTMKITRWAATAAAATAAWLALETGGSYAIDLRRPPTTPFIHVYECSGKERDG